MSTRPLAAPCPHELRPSTTRCLHCASEARAAARARGRRTAGRVGLAVVLGTVIAVVLNAGSTVLHIPAPPPSMATFAAAAAPPSPRSPDADPAPRYAARNAATPLQPRIAEGRTELRDSVVALRAGNTVTVFFDTPAMRTRRKDKFQQIVRATLPQVYGARLDSLLAAIPAEQLTAGGDLLTELPVRGVQLRLADGATLALWPETRPGRDGPLVVAYRSTLTH